MLRTMRAVAAARAAPMPNGNAYYPRTMRTPISRVRCATVKANNPKMPMRAEQAGDGGEGESGREAKLPGGIGQVLTEIVEPGEAHSSAVCSSKRRVLPNRVRR